MKVSELFEKIKILMLEHGDLPVYALRGLYAETVPVSYQIRDVFFHKGNDLFFPTPEDGFLIT